jgi:hypothetical protein
VTDAAPGFAIWKNVDRGLAGAGDLDAVAPASEWPMVAAEHRRWTLANGLGPPLECRHVPGLLLLVAFSPDAPGSLLQLDVSTHIFAGGGAMVPATRVEPLLRLDARGFRALRPGAEGLFKLLQSATSSRRPWTTGGVDPGVAELLESDPIGAQDAARLLGRVGPAGRRAARAAAAGRCDRRAEIELSGWCLLAAVRHPVLPAMRIASGLGPARSCPLIAALQRGRRVPRDLDAWLAQVATTHSRQTWG